jgi:polyisoprenoid-binding protein YceI
MLKSTTIFGAIALLGLAFAAPLSAQTVLKTSETSSTIEAVGSKITGDHTLTFKRFDGEARVEKGKVTGLSFTLDMKSFTTEMGDAKWGKKLVSHLKSPDFFEVEKHPEASFVSTLVEAKESKWGTHRVTGNLKLRGKTVLVRFPATIAVSASAVKGQAEFTINRKDFGIVYKGKPDNLIKDDVLLKIALDFER